MCASIGVATTAPTMPDAISRMTKTTMPRPPSRPTTAPLPDVAMPTIRSETTSGMTVIRIALTKIVPTGSTTATIVARELRIGRAEEEPEADAGGEREQYASGERHAPKLRPRACIPERDATKKGARRGFVARPPGILHATNALEIAAAVSARAHRCSRRNRLCFRRCFRVCRSCPMFHREPPDDPPIPPSCQIRPTIHPFRRPTFRPYCPCRACRTCRAMLSP